MLPAILIVFVLEAVIVKALVKPIEVKFAQYELVADSVTVKLVEVLFWSNITLSPLEGAGAFAIPPLEVDQ